MLEIRPTRRAGFLSGVSRGWVLGFVGYGLAVLVAYLLSLRGVGPTLCPLRLAFDIPCPLCGGTRTAHALLTGRWADAIATNPLVTISAAGFAVWSLVWLGFGLRVGLRLGPAQTISLLLLFLALNWAYVLHRSGLLLPEP